jgi:hypothetical protein
VQLVFMTHSGMIVDVLEKSGRQFANSGVVNWDCFRLFLRGKCQCFSSVATYASQLRTKTQHIGYVTIASGHSELDANCCSSCGAPSPIIDIAPSVQPTTQAASSAAAAARAAMAGAAARRSCRRKTPRGKTLWHQALAQPQRHSYGP